MNGLRLIRTHELAYLRGVARGAAKMQRASSHSRDWNERMQQKVARLREQIACDQAYIDALEERISADDLKRVRMQTREIRSRRARL